MLLCGQYLAILFLIFCQHISNIDNQPDPVVKKKETKSPKSAKNHKTATYASKLHFKNIDKQIRMKNLMIQKTQGGLREALVINQKV